MNKKIFLAILVTVVALVTYFNRWIFKFKFEPEYWENYYYESQWNIANSPRIISDEGVYRYIGYRLVNGENPFNVDYWVPPLGKWMYGFAAKYFGNPYLVSFVFYLLSLYIFYLLAKEIVTNELAWVATLLFALNPLLVEQIGQTMLDIFLMFFLLATIWGWVKTIKKDKNETKYFVLSGLFLGLMAGIKPPFFVPAIGLVGMIFLKNKKIKIWWSLPFLTMIGYCLAYFCYFLKHPNPIPFIRLHEKVIEFHRLGSGGNHNILNMFRTIFFGLYKGHWVGAKTIRPLNWSIILPMGSIGIVYVLTKFKKYKKENEKIVLLSVLGLVYLMMNLMIDFWPRYLLPVVPIFTLIVVWILRNKKMWLGLVFIALLPSLYLQIFPSSKSLVEEFTNKNTAGFYRETYRMLDRKTQDKLKEHEWIEDAGGGANSFTPVKQDNQWKMSLVEE